MGVQGKGKEGEEGERIDLQQELQRCHAFMLWLAEEEEREVNALQASLNLTAPAAHACEEDPEDGSASVNLEHSRLAEVVGSIQEICLTVDKLDTVIDSLDLSVRRILSDNLSKDAKLTNRKAVKKANEEAARKVWERRTKRLDPVSRGSSGDECRVVKLVRQGFQKTREEINETEPKTVDDDSRENELLVCRLHVRAERAEDLVQTLRTHLERARMQTKKVEETTAKEKLVMQEEVQRMQRQLRASAHDMRILRADSEAKLKIALDDAKRCQDEGNQVRQKLQQQVDALKRKMTQQESEQLQEEEKKNLEMQRREEKLQKEMERREQTLHHKEMHLRAASKVAISEAQDYAQRLYEECHRELLAQLDAIEARNSDQAEKTARRVEGFTRELGMAENELRLARLQAQAAKELAVQNDVRLNETITTLRQRERELQTQVEDKQHQIARLNQVLRRRHDELVDSHKHAADALLSASIARKPTDEP